MHGVQRPETRQPHNIVAVCLLCQSVAQSVHMEGADERMCRFFWRPDRRCNKEVETCWNWDCIFKICCSSRIAVKQTAGVAILLCTHQTRSAVCSWGCLAIAAIVLVGVLCFLGLWQAPSRSRHFPSLNNWAPLVPLGWEQQAQLGWCKKQDTWRTTNAHTCLDTHTHKHAHTHTYAYANTHF